MRNNLKLKFVSKRNFFFKYTTEKNPSVYINQAQRLI